MWKRSWIRWKKKGIISKIETSEWGSPLVPVLKDNGEIRVCADYKTTVNEFLEDVPYPFPRIQDIFQSLQGGQLFTKLDFSGAYNQLVLDEETACKLAWSTHKCIFKANRLPFGTKPACALFQREVEKTLQGCKNTLNLLDDIVVTGRSVEEHVQNLNEVLSRLQNSGFKLNASKCEFFKEEIRYLGHVVNKDGLKKCSEKLRTVVEAPKPSNVTELRAFVGMVNYYGNFVKNLSTLLSPLYKLLQSGVQYKWTNECDESFLKVKKELTSDNVLVHFDPSLPLILECNASQYGLGRSFYIQCLTESNVRFVTFQGHCRRQKRIMQSCIRRPWLFFGQSRSCTNT